jgi:hypothetical protein
MADQSPSPEGAPLSDLVHGAAPEWPEPVLGSSTLVADSPGAATGAPTAEDARPTGPAAPQDTETWFHRWTPVVLASLAAVAGCVVAGAVASSLSKSASTTAEKVHTAPSGHSAGHEPKNAAVIAARIHPVVVSAAITIGGGTKTASTPESGTAVPDIGLPIAQLASSDTSA